MLIPNLKKQKKSKKQLGGFSQEEVMKVFGPMVHQYANQYNLSPEMFMSNLISEGAGYGFDDILNQHAAQYGVKRTNRVVTPEVMRHWGTVIQQYPHSEMQQVFKSYPLSGAEHLGLDISSSTVKRLVEKGKLPKEILSRIKFQETDINDRSNKSKKETVYFKDMNDMFQVGAAVLDRKKGQAEKLMDRYGYDKNNNDALNFWTYVSYNGGAGTAEKMMQDFNDRGLNVDNAYLNRNIKSPWGQAKANATQRLGNQSNYNFQNVPPGVMLPGLTIGATSTQIPMRNYPIDFNDKNSVKPVSTAVDRKGVPVEGYDFLPDVYGKKRRTSYNVPFTMNIEDKPGADPTPVTPSPIDLIPGFIPQGVRMLSPAANQLNPLARKQVLDVFRPLKVDIKPSLNPTVPQTTAKNFNPRYNDVTRGSRGTSPDYYGTRQEGGYTTKNRIPYSWASSTSSKGVPLNTYSDSRKSTMETAQKSGKGYIPYLSEFAYKKFRAEGIDGSFNDVNKSHKAIKYQRGPNLTEKEASLYFDGTNQPITYNIDNDFYRKYLGMDYNKDFVQDSPYKPTLAKDQTASYYRLNQDWLNKDAIVYTALKKLEESGKDIYHFNHKKDSPETISFFRSPEKSYNGLPNVNYRIQDPLQNFILSKGQDDKGHYVSMYDKWDIAANAFEGTIGKPFEIYDRVYYNPETKMPLESSEFNRRQLKNKIRQLEKFPSNNSPKQKQYGGLIDPEDPKKRLQGQKKDLHNRIIGNIDSLAARSVSYDKIIEAIDPILLEMDDVHEQLITMPPTVNPSDLSHDPTRNFKYEYIPPKKKYGSKVKYQDGGTLNPTDPKPKAKKTQIPYSWGAQPPEQHHYFPDSYSDTRKAELSESPEQARVRKMKYFAATGLLPELKNQNLLTRAVRKPLVKNLVPYKYPPNISAFLKAAKNVATGTVTYTDGEPASKFWERPVSDYVTPTRSDIFRMSLGYPQQHDSFEPSPYMPTKSKDKSKVYLRPKSLDNQTSPNMISYRIQSDAEQKQEIVDAALSYGQPSLVGKAPDNWKQLAASSIHGQIQETTGTGFTVDLGEDELGSYVSYWDIWDYSKGPNIGKPIEIYDRIYYDKKTKKVLEKQPTKNQNNKFSIEHKANGGYTGKNIKKYQEGGEFQVPEKRKFLLKDSRDWVTSWLNHPESKQRAKNYGINDLTPYITRVKNTGVMSNIAKPEEISPGGQMNRFMKAPATYDPDSNLIFLNVSPDTLDQIPGRSRDEYNRLLIHELSHGTNLDQVFQKYSPKSTLNPELQDYFNTGESWPRLMEIRYELGVQPGEKLNQEHIDKAKQIMPNNLIWQSYTDDEIIDMINKFVINSPKKNKILTAKRGKKLTGKIF